MSIIGNKDSREPVADNSVFPFSAVVAIDTLDPGSSGRGTGIMIGPGHVLTAGHNGIYKGVQATAIRVTLSANESGLTSKVLGNPNDPGANVTLPPTYLKNYDTSGASDDDVAIFVTTSNNFTTTSNSVGLIAFMDASTAVGYSIITAGYPGDKGTGALKGREFTVSPGAADAPGSIVSTSSSGERFYYSADVDTYAGQSGSGVWHVLAGDTQARVLGIHTQGGSSANSGTLITKDLYDSIIAKMDADTNGGNANTLPENAIVGTDSFLTIGGNDVIEGTYRKERIIGQGGEDQIRGGGADDRLEGGSGTDQAIFSGEFKDFTFIENPDGSYTFTDGNAADGLDEGTDSLKDFEFAIFEKANAADSDVFIVPLPIKDGPDTKETGDIKSVDGTATVGAATLEAPAWMFDGDIDYTFTMSGSAVGSLYNFAYIIDKSGSMSGSNLQIAQEAYETLTQDLINRGVADYSDFVVIPFDSNATSSGTLDAQGAIAAVNALNAGGGTSFTQALSLAETWFNGQSDHQNAINIAFFLSDGQGSGASANLQQLSDGTRVEVRAYGIGSGANLNSLNTIDSDNAVLLTDPADLVDEFKKAGVSKDVIDHIDVKLDGVLVDTILPDQLTEDPLGLQITGSITGLEVTKTARNLVTFDVIFNDGRPTATVTKEVTTGQEEIIKQTANGTKVVELSVGQSSFLGSVLGAFNSIINGNEVSNQITDGAQNDQIFTFGGDDIITMGGGGTNLVDGGDGQDVVIYSGARSSYSSVTKSGGVVKVGNDSLLNVEQIQFDDVVIDTATMQESIFATLSPVSTTIDEEGTDAARLATFTVTLAKAATATVVVEFNILNGTTTAGTDHSGSNQLVTIAAGQTTANFTVQILNDTEVELDETLVVEATLGTGAKFRSGASAAQSGVTIDDGDIALSVSSVDGFVFEGDSGTTVQLTMSIVRAGDTTNAMSVNYAVQGVTPDAADAADFLNGVLPSGIVNFAAGESSVDVTVTIQGDDMVEPTESFEVVLSNPSIAVSSLSGAVFQISNRVQFIGTSNGDTLIGNEIDNELFGLGNDDLLEGRLGADILNGGDGADTAIYDRSAQGVTVDLRNGTGSGGEAEGDTLFEIENIAGSAQADILYGNGLSNIIGGGDGDDQIQGFGGADFLVGGLGNDTLEGGADADFLVGGGGIDTARYSQSAQGVTVNLGAGTGSGGEAEGDTLLEIENVDGSAQADTLIGNGFANVLTGDGGDDMLEGGAAADVLIGGDGIDTARYSQSAQGVTVNLDTGTGTGGEAEGDVLFGIENVVGSGQADILYGNGFANVLSGGEGGDQLLGLSGADVLSGDGGNDMLEGGDDADVLIGGDGIDTARYDQSAQGVTINLGNGTGSGGEAEGDTLFDIENVVGSNQADILYGNGFANLLEGGASQDQLFGFTGADVLFGGGGDDLLEGGADADALVGGSGIDTARYSQSAQGVTVNLDTGTGTGGEAEGDVLLEIENVVGSAQADTLRGDGFTNVLSGGDGHDQLFGFGGADVLLGEGGDDLLDGGTGADVLIGGDGIDTAGYSQSAQGVTVNLGNGTGTGGEADGDTLFDIENVVGSSQADTLYGNGLANILAGGEGGDELFGFTGADTLRGDGGNDRLEGGDDADILLGGAGLDTAVYRQSTQGVTINLGNGTGTGGEAEGDTLFGIENVDGSNQADILYGNGFANVLAGGEGGDQLLGFTGADVLSGDGGDDTLEGGADADVLIGGVGIDTARYNQSAQGVTINLGNGTGTGGEAEGDTLFGIENVDGSNQADILYGSGFANVFAGGEGGDQLFGFSGADVLSGDGGDDTLEGGDDADVLIGGDGIDTARYNQSAQGVTINLGNGTGSGGEAEGDTLFGIENVVGSAQADILYGNGLANVLTGGAGDDQLFGFTGFDVLYGDGGNDRLEGGADADILIGGADVDTAVYRQSAQGVTINLGNGTGTGGEAEGDTLFDIENVDGSNQADILYGNGFANVFAGGEGGDQLLGFTGADVLSGDGGNDMLEGGDDADVLIGGDGIDTARYSQSAQGVTINLGNGTGTGGEAEGDTLFGIENVDGSNQADILYGSGFANVFAGGEGGDQLFGFSGADVLSGDGGNDTLEGGADADVLIGGDGIDTARYSQSAQGVTINLGNGTGTGGEAEGDTLFGIENVDGSNQADILYGNGFANVLAGGEGGDQLLGFTGADVLSGDGGNDRLEGGDDADVLIGGTGIDTVIYRQSTQGVMINLGNGTGTGGEAEGDMLFDIENVDGSNQADILYGNGFANILTGGEGGDQLYGFTGADVLAGDGGDDTLEGGADADVLIGGAGMDIARYGQSAQGVTINLGNGTGSGGEAEGDRLFDIENVDGSNQADILYGNGFANVLAGGEGDDQLLGFTGADVLAGDGGNDILEGGDDADILIGGTGIDTARYSQSTQGVTINLGNGTGTGGEAEGDTLFDIENVDGSNQADTLYGNGFANVLVGGEGADELFGFTGADVLAGDGGDDTLEGGADADVLIGGSGIDTAIYRQSTQGVTVNLGNGTGSGGEAEGDRLFDIENVDGSNQADILYGNGFANVLAGGEGDDQLLGFTGADVLAGDGGNDILEGGDDADILIGGTGIDTARYSQSTQGVTINLGNGTGTGGEAEGDTLFDIENVTGSAQVDILYGNGFANVLSGGEGGDQLLGFTGADVLSGDGGDDRLEGGDDADVLIGGSGIDTAIYRQSTQGVMINLGNGTGNGGEAEGDTLFDIENVDGSNQADTLYGNGFANVLVGGEGADELFGFTGADVLAGDGGDDTLEGGADADVLIGGSGIDTAIYRQSTQGVTVNLGNGTGTGGEAEGDTLFDIENVVGSDVHADTIYGNGFANGLQGMGGADLLYGFGGEDIINGGDGGDFLDGGDERDILYGENGDDILIGGAGEDALIGQQGNDRLFGGADNDALDGGADDDDLRGDGGNDYLLGGDGNDSLYGDDGFDTLVGGSGVDTLTGGTGNDTLTGGADSDFFIFQVGSGVDAITDFEDGIDLIDLSGYTGVTSVNTAIGQSGLDTVVTIAGSADQIVLVGFNAVNLTVDSDFVFA